jgi:hypothetical protein
MAHSTGQASWRASAIEIPSGADVAQVYRLLAAPPESALRVVQLSAYGSGGSARFSAILIPPGQGTAAIYAVVASEPIYVLNGPFPANAATQVLPTVILPEITSNQNTPWFIPAGWSLGIMPTASTTGPTYVRAVAVKSKQL